MQCCEKNLDVHIVADGTSSMRQFDRLTGFSVLSPVVINFTYCVAHVSDRCLHYDV